MSRIGNKPVDLKGTKVSLAENVIKVEGPKGNLKFSHDPQIKLEVLEKEVQVKNPFPKEKKFRALHGLTRALIANMVSGVTTGYEKKLEINGVGYRAKVEGKDLVLSLGFSHPVRFPLPEGISAKVERKDTLIILNGIDKQLLGDVAASIRKFRPPEPYKGKGIKYEEEVIRRKKGKRVA